jgi:hypothetical protein
MISRNKIGLGNLMNEAPKPGDFPVGSVESRAAVRAMIERDKETGLRWRIIMERVGQEISRLAQSNRGWRCERNSQSRATALRTCLS